MRVHDDPVALAAATASATAWSVRALAITARLERELSVGHPLVIGRLVVLEPLGELVGVIEDLLQGTGHGDHLRNLGRAIMA